MNLRYLAAPLLALSLLPAQAQTSPAPKQTAKQAYQAPQRDEEFLKLYDDVKWFERSNGDSGMGSGRTAAKAFADRASKLWQRYRDLEKSPIKLYTCGEYLHASDESKNIRLGEFYAVLRERYDSAEVSVKKIRVNPDNFSEKNTDIIDAQQSLNFQPVSETSFSDLRRAVIVYNSQVRNSDNSWAWDRRICASDQLYRIGGELAKLSGLMIMGESVWGYIKDDWKGHDAQILAPSRTGNIVVEGRGRSDMRDNFYYFILSVAPNGKAKLWMNANGINAGSQITEELNIKFGKK